MMGEHMNGLGKIPEKDGSQGNIKTFRYFYFLVLPAENMALSLYVSNP
jgi:hypothetical protein